MKKIKSLVIPALLTFALASSSLAASNKPQCPNADILRTTGLSIAKINDGTYAATQFDNFGTGQLWGFGVTNIKAASQSEALAKANMALQNLAFQSGPFHSSSIGAWACIYSIGSGYKAVALTASSAASLVKDIAAI